MIRLENLTEYEFRFYNQWLADCWAVGSKEPGNGARYLQRLVQSITRRWAQAQDGNNAS